MHDGETHEEPQPPRPAARWPLLVALAVSAAAAAAVLFGYVLRDVPDAEGVTGSPGPSPALVKLREKWGTKRYSQHDEEIIIRDFFQDRKGGFFLDVGASHHRVNSTSYYLERHLGWEGIAIDALAKFRPGYEKHRPRTRFFSYFVSDESDQETDFYVVESNDRLSSGEQLVKDWRKGDHHTVKTRTITLNDLLEREGVTDIDFMSMDIEFHEPEGLAGFDIQKYRPELVCIEGHRQVRDAIYQYFEAHGYVELEHYSALDPLNLYFAPADHPAAARAPATEHEVAPAYPSE